MDSTQRAGVVVAGGRSTRFGDVDKAVADLAGTPMTRRVADRLARVVDSVVVNCRADQRAALSGAMADADYPVRFAVDPDEDRGPMAGIMTGLRAVAGEYAVVVACDMPFVDPEFLAYLFDRIEGQAGPPADQGRQYDAAVPRPDEWYQPTQAAYRADAMADACEAALDRGDSKILAPLDDLDWVVVDAAEVEAHAATDTFDNVNTREEFDRAIERIQTDSPG